MYRFELQHTCKRSGARAGRIHTDHGVIDTPAFMPVGTQGAIKAGVLLRDVHETGARIMLGNTYHLMLRPGAERIEAAGGLHRFTAWQGALLTDSGGYQVYSLARTRKVDDRGVTFQSHFDGDEHRLDAERAVALQEAFGTDIAMAFDECPPAGAPRAEVERAMRRTTAWLDRCLAARRRADRTALYGIVQGGVHEDLRSRHVEEICTRDGCEGFAIGGLSVGEENERMIEVCGHTAALMPADKARYLMGVGTPADLVRCVGLGVDQFDCVLPTRNGRHGKLYTFGGRLYIKNARFTEDDGPIDPTWSHPLLAAYSRSYLRHLLIVKEDLCRTLCTLHNLAFYQELMRQARAAIFEDRYDLWSAEVLEGLQREA